MVVTHKVGVTAVIVLWMGVVGAMTAHGQTTGQAIELGEPYRWTPLHVAARDGNLDQVKQLVQSGANLEATEHHGRTPLYIASAFGKRSVVEYLISRGANVNARDQWGYTPLQRMALLRDVRGFDRQAIAQLLRQHGGLDQ